MSDEQQDEMIQDISTTITIDTMSKLDFLSLSMSSSSF